jgi:phage terminase small subunit
LSKKKITHLQQNFVNNILSGLNQTDAYMAAGYKCSRSAARSNAVRLMLSNAIRSEIEKGQKKAAYKAEISQQRILEEEKTLAFFDPGGLVDENGRLLDLHKLPPDVRRAIAGLEIIKQVDGNLKYKYRFTDKGKSLERISRHLGLYNDKLNLGLSSETLNAILSGLPDEYAEAVRKALGELVSKK